MGWRCWFGIKVEGRSNVSWEWIFGDSCQKTYLISPWCAIFFCGTINFRIDFFFALTVFWLLNGANVLNLIADFMGFISVAMLGLTAGAMLTEAVIIVPFWQKLTPSEFFAWYTKNQAALVRFYSPLEILSAVLPLISSILFFIIKNDGKWLMATSTLLSLCVLATFFIFFKNANAVFNARAMDRDKFSLAIKTWGNWQWIRVGLGVGAFCCGILAI